MANIGTEDDDEEIVLPEKETITLPDAPNPIQEPVPAVPEPVYVPAGPRNDVGWDRYNGFRW